MSSVAVAKIRRVAHIAYFRSKFWDNLTSMGFCLVLFHDATQLTTPVNNKKYVNYVHIIRWAVEE